MNEVEKSICMIETVTAHLKENYDSFGGGISSIKLLSSNSIEAEMLQEERKDVWIYTLEPQGDGFTVTNVEKTAR
ncbi:hypothetical protein [Nereida sp. MMG025]|uniref:hypothetical protein n=1 Tax=Nereida sp. MMG025 TaxID=2909981 RepID=UPI001F44C930|nr:hypothetical protein [Nereida sp. MMG025]MCF6445763.1 hypothetical protein [Nereida sp. MMG025]